MQKVYWNLITARHIAEFSVIYPCIGFLSGMSRLKQLDKVGAKCSWMLNVNYTANYYATGRRQRSEGLLFANFSKFL